MRSAHPRAISPVCLKLLVSRALRATGQNDMFGRAPAVPELPISFEVHRKMTRETAPGAIQQALSQVLQRPRRSASPASDRAPECAVIAHMALLQGLQKPENQQAASRALPK